ncbi:c-type cytochrome biogenesis protein CcsB [Catenulispora yoronensis]
MFVYLIAFFAYTAEWVFGRKSSFVVTAAEQSAAGKTAAGKSAGAQAAATVPAQAEALVAAGGQGAGGGQGGDAKPVTVPDDLSGLDELDDLADLDDLPDLDEPDPVIDGGNLRAITAGGIAVSTTVLAFLLHVVGVACRGLAAHRVPWGNLYEFTIAGSAVAMAIYVGLLFRKNARWLGVFVTGFVVVILGLAVEVLYKDAEQLVPALHSPWLVIHVAAAVLCSGAFTVATLATVLYLFKSRYETRAKLGTASPGSMWRRVPSAMKLDLVAYRILAFSFPIWTFTVIAGSIWAERAWGRYWGWDPTETWAFITWVVYAAYLHARATRGWKGRNASIVALVGYGCFIFNYFVVSIFVNGLHSYANVK